MPKYNFDGHKLVIGADDTNPHDKLKEMKKANKGKHKTDLTDKQKADIFDAYVDAGVITL